MSSTPEIPGELERRELPFQPHSATPLSPASWSTLLLAVALAYALMLIPWTPPFGDAGRVARGAAFCLLPLLGLWLAAGRWWTAPAHALTARDAQWIVAGSLLTMTASVGVALLLLHGTELELSPNPIVRQLERMPPLEFAALLLTTLPQLAGEELLTILPLLAVLALLRQRTQLGALASAGVASVASSVLFAAAHLPTYDWKVVQCFAVIGTARLVLNLAYLQTRNLWVPIGAHVLTDWSYFVALVYGREI